MPPMSTQKFSLDAKKRPKSCTSYYIGDDDDVDEFASKKSSIENGGRGESNL